MKRIKIVIFFLIVIALLGGGIAYTLLTRFTPSNTPNTVGNTAGNLNNGGLFVEGEDVVYFSNPYDSGCVYSMTSDENNFKKVTSNHANNLLYDNKNLYYYMDVNGGGKGIGTVIKLHGIYRADPDGKDSYSVDSGMAIIMQLVGNYIYYQNYDNTNFTTVYRIKTDGSDKAKVTDSIINPVAVSNGIIYFNGTDKDHNLYGLNTMDNSTFTVLQGNIWFPQCAGDYIYYMDASSNYRLCRYSLTSRQNEILTKDRVDTFNVGSQYIYYQFSDKNNPALKRMLLDGSNPEIVANGTYNKINLTSQYAYFYAFNDDLTIYHTPVNGPIMVETFNGALEAAIEHQGDK